MKLYIRDRERHVLFVHSVEELMDFSDMYVGQEVVIGDLSTFNRPMVQRLLKLLEENPRIDCYSSYDIDDPILLSRFTEVIKVPLEKRVVEIGEVVNYYTVQNGTKFSPEDKLHYVNNPELRNLIKSCRSE